LVLGHWRYFPGRSVKERPPKLYLENHMLPILVVISVSRQLASLIALVGTAIVICSFILERAPVGSKWRRLAFGDITLAGSGFFLLSAWLAYLLLDFRDPMRGAL